MIQHSGQENAVSPSVQYPGQPAGGKHGVQGEGDKQGNHYRKGHGDAELEKKTPHDPLHKGHRNKDGYDG